MIDVNMAANSNNVRLLYCIASAMTLHDSVLISYSKPKGLKLT